MRIFYQAVDKVKDALAYIRKETNNYYKFGEGDDLPNCMIRRVNDSGTARACVSKLSAFIQGNGLVDEELGSSKANRAQSWNSVIADLSQIDAYFQAVTFRVMYNNAGEPAVVYPVQTQQLRRLGYTKFAYNPLMGEQFYNRSKDKTLCVYDPDESKVVRLKRIADQIEEYGEQFGDIVYHFKKGVGLYADIYPVPDYYSGIDDIDSDAGISRLEKRNIYKGWKAQVTISTGPIDKDNKDDNGKTDYDKFSSAMQKFTGEEGATILHLEGASDAAKPTVTILPIADILDQTEAATERLGRKVCRLMGVPPVLVGFATPGQLGNVQELLNSIDLFKMVVIERQDLLKEALRIPFPDRNWDIKPLTLWEPKTVTANEAPKI